MANSLTFSYPINYEASMEVHYKMSAWIHDSETLVFI